MPKHPTFSVCIPNFNYGSFLGRTLESVLDQTFTNFEVIVADNASTDHSVEVVKSFSDPRLRLIVNRYNVGFSPNLDRATEQAKGRHMILLSSDDLMRPNALARYAEILSALGDSERDRAVLTSAVELIDAEDHPFGVSYRKEGELFYREDTLTTELGLNRGLETTDGMEALKASLLAKNSPAVFLATCYPKVIYEAVEGYHNCQRMWPDSHFLNKILTADTKLVYVPETLFAYRIHNQNQLASEAKAGALKYQVDSYMHTVEFPEEVLEKLNLRRDSLKRVFVEKALMERGLQSMAAGSWVRALQCWSFGWASYPDLSWRFFKTWALGLLLLLGPLGKLVARVLYTRYLRKKN